MPFSLSSAIAYHIHSYSATPLLRSKEFRVNINEHVATADKDTLEMYQQRDPVRSPPGISAALS